MPKEELLEEIGIPLTPVRLKCAILGLTTAEAPPAQGQGTPLPRASAELDELELASRAGVDVCRSRSCRREMKNVTPAASILSPGGELFALETVTTGRSAGEFDTARRLPAPRRELRHPSMRSRCRLSEPCVVYPVRVVDGVFASRSSRRVSGG